MADEVTAAFAALRYTLETLKTALGLAKDAKDLMPDDGKKEEVEKALEAADESAAQAFALLAKEFKYTLCKCDFPPTPALFVRHDKLTGQEISKCPKCETEYPPKLDPLPDGRRRINF